MKPILNPGGQLWDMEMHVLGDVGSFDYYGYVIRKKSTGAGSAVAAPAQQLSSEGDETESEGDETEGEGNVNTANDGD